MAALPVAIGLTVLLILAAVPLTLWLSTKLLLAPASIILEHATIRGAVVRSWTLIRGRFWPALGIVVIISLTFGAIAQVISLPFSFLSSGLTTIIAPTGAPEPSAIIAIIAGAVLTQVVTLLIQSVAVVVQATATSIIYIDCRMRREGLDLDLLTYIERRDGGATALPDPYRENVGREIAPRPTAYAPGYGGYPPPPYPGPPAAPGYATAPGYAPAPGYASTPGHPPTPGYAPAPGHPPTPGYAPAPGYAPPPPYSPPPASAAPPDPTDDAPPTRWTAPGARPDRADPDSPWS